MITKGKYIAVVEAKTAAEFAVDVEAIEAEGYVKAADQWFAHGADGFAAVFGCPALDPTAPPASVADEAVDVMVPDAVVPVKAASEGMYA